MDKERENRIEKRVEKSQFNAESPHSQNNILL